MIGVFEIDRLEKELERTREKLEHVTEEMNHSCPDCEMARRLEVEQQAHERTASDLTALRPVVRAAITYSEHSKVQYDTLPDGARKLSFASLLRSGFEIVEAVRALTPEVRKRIEEER